MKNWFQQKISITTNGKKAQDITYQIKDLVAQTNFSIGLCHCFVQHTSASLIICIRRQLA